MKRSEEIVFFGILFCLIIISSSFAVTLEDTTSSSLDIKGGILCNGSGTFWEDTTTHLKTFTMGLDNAGNCYNEKGRSSDGVQEQVTCCADLYDCTDDADDLIGYYCKLRQNPTQEFCWDFESSKSDCEGTSSDGRVEIAKKSNNISQSPSPLCGADAEHAWINASGATCYNTTYCRCKWNENDNSCEVNKTTGYTCSYQGKPEKFNDGECFTKCIEPYCNKDECDTNGYIITQLKGTPSGDYPHPDECAATKEIKIPCESVTKLGFFDFINFIEALFIIALVYFIYVNKSKHKK